MRLERDEPELEADVERLHRFLLREQPEPEEGREPVPWWLWAGAVLAIFAGGFYLGRFGGVFSTATHIGFQRPGMQVIGETPPVTVSGAQVYQARCASCHQVSGLGVPGAFPPLVGTDWVTGDAEVVIKILLDGIEGPLEVRGAVYNGVMPAWRDVLSSAELSAVASYIRQMETNAAAPVDVPTVARIKEETAGRDKPWTAAELKGGS